MKTMEQIIREKGREQFYDYYRSLGYTEKTAAVLTLFTYGDYRYTDLTIDAVYEALLHGEEYLPQELQELRRHPYASPMRYTGPLTGSSMPRAAGGPAFGAAMPRAASGPAPGSTPAIPRSGPAPQASAKPKGNILSSIFGGRKESSPIPPIARMSRQSAPDAYAGMPTSAPHEADFSVDEEIDDSLFLEEEITTSPMIRNSGSGKILSGRPSPGLSKEFLRLAGAADFATDEYEHIEEKDARHVAMEPVSTFRMTTNTASAGVILNQLRNGRRIDRSMVRIEEMLNYFRYESRLPEREMFGISYELMDAGKDDTGHDRKYLYINVQGREEVKERQNIVLLLDVSGSMSSNAEQTQAIVATLLSKLGDGDRLSLVTYSNEDHVVLEAFTINGPEDRERVLEKLLALEISGGTYGSKGIDRAYEIGKAHYIKGGNNQVILITDGDLNFGITDKGGLEELIEKKKKDNLFLSVIGTGLFNYKDDKLETLSKHGNGVYRTVNNLADVQKSVRDEYASLVNIIAKDVKAQVEFNPEVVESYRLLGFENRTLAREDFANDKVISEPFGSGGYGVALYALTMKPDGAAVDSGLKYSRVMTTGSKEVGTVRIRYKEPLADHSHELEKVIESAAESFTDNLRLAFVVYACAEKLRGSSRISGEELALAKKLYGELGGAIRQKNAEDLYKLAGMLDKSEKELGIGIPDEEPFRW